MDKSIIISIKTILITFLALLAGYLIYRLGPVFAILLVALLIVLALEPLIKWFASQVLIKRPLGRSLAVIITYVIVVSTLVSIIAMTVGLPPVISQGQRLLLTLSGLLADLNTPLTGGAVSLPDLRQVSQVLGNLLGAVSSGFSTITTMFTLLMISIYMSLDWENLKRRFISLFPNKFKLEVLRIIEEIETNVGHWVKGQLVLMLVIGSLSFVGLAILQVPYPLALGLIAGVLEIVPILGPVISAVLAAIIAFSDTPLKSLAVIALFIGIQQLENNLLVPKIMQKVSGFSPLVILVALLIGSNFFGIVGAIIAVPVTMIAAIVIKSILKHTN